MDNTLHRKYGLFTTICMVVGIVIGSGVFFKAQTILEKTGGNMPMGILAWLIGGAIMLVCLLSFAFMGQKYERVNGLVDYAEATVSSRYGYYVGWFSATIYFPAMTSVLAWVSARYTLVFITEAFPGLPMTVSGPLGCLVGPECMVLTLIYLCGSYFINAISPKLAGKFQTSTTVIKLIPLALMAAGGVIAGLISGILPSNFNSVTDESVISTGSTLKSPLFTAVCSTAFAYEGWIIATSINAEIKDSKKNLPRALIIGGIIIAAVYVSYYIGVAGGASIPELIDKGATIAFTNLFGNFLGNVLNLFIAISCLGTLNGLMLGCSRCMYAIAVRGEGPAPEVYSQVDSKTNMPTNSSAFALLITAAWFLYFYVTNLYLPITAGVEGKAFMFDSSELPIITIYLMYLPILINWMRRERSLSVLRRFILPGLAIAGSLFMIVACIFSHRMGCLWYLIVFAAVMLLGKLADRSKKQKAS